MVNRVKKLYLDDKRRKIIFFVLLGISFVAVWIYNVMTPLMSDDLLFKTSDYHSLLEDRKSVV